MKKPADGTEANETPRTGGVRRSEDVDPDDVRRTPSGLPLPTFAAVPSGEKPGEYPFTRGIHPDMYRGKLWTMRQYSGFGSARETNRRFRYLLDQGQSGLSVAFDLPTQIGYDSCDPEAAGEVGKVGVPISTLEDLEALFDGIALDRTSVSMTINSSAAILLAFLVALARRRGIAPENLRGTLQNDILKEFVARHTQRFPLAPSMRLVADVLEYSTRNLPKWNPISISGYHIREAGSTAVEEVAFTLSNAMAYLECARERGIPLEPLARRISFFFNSQMHFLEEIAKFRAARRLWARLLRERFEVRDAGACRLRFHTQTAGAALTYQQQENNVVRVTIQALAAVLGGTQSLHTNGADEALGLPTEETARTALRTQQILAHEAGVADVADPLGGAPLIEQLTDTIEERVLEQLEEIDRHGGPLRAVESGAIQRWVEESSYRYQQSVESGDRVVVGVNRFTSEDGEEAHNTFRVEAALEAERVRELRERLEARSSSQSREIQDGLEQLKDAARGSENLMEPLILCAERGASLGEMMGNLASVFGEFQGDL